MKKILVVGGAGYLGSVFCREILTSGFKIKVLDKLLFGGESLIDLLPNSNFELIKGDICRKKDLIAALKGVNAVVNFAALVGDHACQPQPHLAWQINYKAALSLAKESQKMGIKRFIFLSTCSNYGICNSLKLATEESAVKPISIYAETKVKAEKAILKLKNKNFHPCILRLATVFGNSPRMRFDLLLNEFLKDAFIFKKLTLYQPEAWRPVIHVRDVSWAIFLCLNAPLKKISGQIFNVGLANYQKKQLVGMIKKYLPGIKLEIKKTDRDNRDYRVSFKKIEKKLGFRPKIKLKKGIKEIINYLKLGIFPQPQHYRYSNVPWPKI